MITYLKNLVHGLVRFAFPPPLDSFSAIATKQSRSRQKYESWKPEVDSLGFPLLFVVSDLVPHPTIKSSININTGKAVSIEVYKS